MHCILALHLEHLLLATRTSSLSSSFNLNKHCPADFYVLYAHPACNNKTDPARELKNNFKTVENSHVLQVPWAKSANLT